MPLDRGQPPHRADHEGIRWTVHPFRAPSDCASDPPELFQVDPAGDDRETILAADAALEVLVPFRFRQRNQAARTRRQETLDLQRQPGGEAPEMTVKHVAVRGMHDDRHSGQPGGEAPHCPGFRGVSMDDHRTLPSEQGHEATQSPQVVDRGDAAGQGRQHLTPDPCRCQTPVTLFGGLVPPLCLPSPWHTRDDQHVEAGPIVPESGQ